MTARELTAREDALFNALENDRRDRTFAGKLCRDGVPSPAIYLRQRVRVIFAFREPNLNGATKRLDLRDEIRDPCFRPLEEGVRQERRPSCWWNAKAGMFAHAVAAALDGKPVGPSYREFQKVVDDGDWHHRVVNRFGYIQIKKIGGGGRIVESEICDFARRYSHVLRKQIELYRPHLVIGGGIGKASPALLLSSLVLPGGRQLEVPTGATWWRFSRASRPMGILQQWHPARRGSRRELYEDLWHSTRQMAKTLGIM